MSHNLFTLKLEGLKGEVQYVTYNILELNLAVQVFAVVTGFK